MFALLRPRVHLGWALNMRPAWTARRHVGLSMAGTPSAESWSLCSANGVGRDAKLPLSIYCMCSR